MILSPTILCFQLDKHSSSNLLNIFKAIFQNGILLDNSQSDIMRNLANNICNIDMQYQDFVRIYMEEIQKATMCNIHFKCSPITCNSTQCSLSLVECISSKFNVDIIIDTPNCNSNQAKVVTIDKYQFCNVEKKRCEYYNNTNYFNYFTDIEKVKAIERVLKFTDKLAIYDAFLGTAASDNSYNLDHYRKTFNYIINIWKNGTVYKFLKLEVTTKIANNANNKDIQDIKRKLQAIFSDLEGVTLTVYLKKDKMKIFHARYLETNSRVFCCEPGFDFFDGEKFRVTSIRVDEGGRKIIEDIKRLQSCKLVF